MALSKIDKDVLKNWTTLTTHIADISSSKAKKLLAYEQANANRSSFVIRLKQRIVGATEEDIKKELD